MPTTANEMVKIKKRDSLLALFDPGKGQQAVSCLFYFAHCPDPGKLKNHN